MIGLGSDNETKSVRHEEAKPKIFLERSARSFLDYELLQRISMRKAIGKNG